MKAKRNKKAKKTLAEFENESDMPAVIQEKQFISDLESEFRKKRGLPDERFFWASARKSVRRILNEADLLQRPQATLFLRLHYPFFDKAVQNVLVERYPGQYPKGREVPLWYPVEAYLVAEQYGLSSYSSNEPESPIGNLDLIENAAQFYFVWDLRWFSRLLLSIADVYEKAKLALDPTKVKTESRLQEWNNRYAAIDQTPRNWLENTLFLARNENKSTVKASKNSLRVRAATINRQRQTIFNKWRDCWEAEFKELNLRLNSFSKH